ncbi:MAG: ketoacyl-ACP synthase III [Burkholderiaceae bacterium]|nr:ketoacyl-ACP synthase III [Burkholderiaceae bacterium]
MGIKIIGAGQYIPPGFEGTEVVAARLGIAADDIVRKTGIEKRHLAGDETASSMGHKALADAIERAGIDKDEIDGVIVATFTGDYLYPSMALKLVQSLGLKAGLAFDLMANCAGMQAAFENARALLLANPKMRVIAVVGIAKQSPFVDPNDENSAYFFGDAAAAVLMGSGGAAPGAGFLPSYFNSHTKNYELVRLRGGGSSYPHHSAALRQDSKALYYEHTGLGVWKEVVVELPKIIRHALDDLGWSVDELDLILFHQANLRLIEYCMARLKLPMSKSLNNVAAIGNTAEASLGTVMCDAFRAGHFGKGKKVLLASVGAGFMYAVTPYYDH